MAASCFSMVTTQVLPSLEATTVTTLGGSSACLKAPCSRLPIMALATASPCHSGMPHARHGISCLTPVLGRRRVLRIRSLAQDSPVAEVVEEAQDIPLVQAEEEVEEHPCIRSFRRKRIGRAIGGNSSGSGGRIRCSNWYREQSRARDS